MARQAGFLPDSDDSDEREQQGDRAGSLRGNGESGQRDSGASTSGGSESTGSAAAVERGDRYLVVARKYRPQSFGDLVGQEHVAAALRAAITTKRIGHAFLFTGARGTGKTSTARILAKALNCERGPTLQPCNQCDICESISAGSDVDALEIDAASNNGIDHIRELRQNANVLPSRARFKIYIIDEVHMLSPQAFNGLLKTLEEPPPHVKFIFCTTESQKIPVTILSRCQRFDFANVQAGKIAERLADIAAQEGVEIDGEALSLLARRAAGSMRDSQSLFEQVLAFGGTKITAADVHRLLGTAGSTRIAGLSRALAARDAAAALGELDRALAEGVDPGQLLEQLLGHFRDILAATAGCGGELLLHNPPSDLGELANAGRELGLETLLALMQILDQALSRMRYSTHVRTLVELALVRVCRLEDLAALGEVISQVASGLIVPGQVKAGSGAARSDDEESKKKAAVELAAMGGGAGVEGGTGAGVEDRARPGREFPGSVASGSGRNGVEATGSGPMDTAAAASEQAKSKGEAEDQDGECGSAQEEWDLERAQAAWGTAIENLGDITAEMAKQGRVVIEGPDQLAVRFPSSYNLQKKHLESAATQEKLREALGEVLGRRVRLRFEFLEGTPGAEGKEEPAAGAPAAAERSSVRRRNQAAVADRPYVRRASELFGGRIVRVEESAAESPAGLR